MSKKGGGGSSRSGGGTVNVSGYYRSNGTYVSGYTRSAPGSGNYSSLGSGSRSTSGCAGGGRIAVSGYTRSDGTQVSSYTRAAPSTGRSNYSSQNTVQVKGYTRSDGTRVSSYTRAAPSISRSDSSSQNTVQVKGYTRSDGTRVSSYTRAAPSISRSDSSSQNTVQVKGYTRSDGTRVSSYTRAAPTTLSDNRSSCNPSSGTTINVSGYTRADGTKVLGYTRVVPQKCGTSNNAVGVKKCYVDNSYNRKIGRVGMPVGSLVIHKDGGHYTRRSHKHQQLLGECLLEDLVQAMRQIQLPAAYQPDHEYEYVDYQYAADQLQRDEVEEEWKKKNVEPSNVDVSNLTSHYPNVLIPFENLQLEKVIGRGGFGEVYAACLLGKPVAFKKLLYQQISRRQTDSFIKEVTILLAVDHPNVIKIIGAVIEENNIGIVMEYLRCSLFRAVFIDCELQDAGKKIAIIKQVASALKHLHSRNIAHCDIKSENILLDWNDNAKLCDFGLSALKNETGSSQSNLVPPGQGTPRYSAPEVLRGEILNMAQLLQADIYSLAIVVFEVMTEEEAFQGLSVMQLQTNVGHGEMRPSTSKLSKPIEDILTKCWAKDAAKRLTASEFQADWNNIDS